MSRLIFFGTVIASSSVVIVKGRLIMPKQNKNSGMNKEGPPRQGEKGGKGGKQGTGAKSGGKRGTGKGKS
jgi:hypothetical protein